MNIDNNRRKQPDDNEQLDQKRNIIDLYDGSNEIYMIITNSFRL